MNFQRASSGFAGLDQILDDLRLGDNVVWQVDNVDDYRRFTKPFAEKAVEEDRRVVYFRFGQHDALLDLAGIEVYEVDASRGFDYFSSTVREIATREGEGVFYVFDCLSELLSEWSNDLMIGNFFRVTCPYLFTLNTIAYFALLRNHHSYQTVARIRDTTQLLLDVYHKKHYYVHPLKVWKRYSPTMFLPHISVGNDYRPLTNSAEVTQLFSSFPQRGLGSIERRLDYWDHMFLDAEELIKRLEPEERESNAEYQAVLDQLLHMVIGNDEKILELCQRFLKIEDLLRIKSRLIGSGLIGGKAVGLILARAILSADIHSDWDSILEPHDSFYIGSDVFYTYLVENDCWQLRQEQKKPETYFTAAADLQEKIRIGIFPDDIREQFLEMLEYFGQAPIIIRSSSLLEDGFGNAFAGKYDSVFCANQGNLMERYEQFIRAVRQVYASTMNEDALTYRLQRGLARSDEQMALLVQRVSGAHRGTVFCPDLAGVALSHNLYVWRDDMNPAAGMLRLVLGLGTRAVDRLDDDYARLVPLDFPLLRTDASRSDSRTYSQHNVDLLNLSNNTMETMAFHELAEKKIFPQLPLFAERAREHAMDGIQDYRWVLTFETLLGDTAFPQVMREMLQVLQEAYHYPVDTEFTANFYLDHNFKINLLQCRPLQVRTNHIRVLLPNDLPEERVIFSSTGMFMGGSLELTIKQIIHIVPEAYAELSPSDKYQIARIVGKLNRLISSKEERPTILLGPGRWGTTTPSLGIPVSFAEINNISVLGEVSFVTGGFVPELSFGSHFFQDLVETGIFYLALHEEKSNAKINRAFFDQAPNALTSLLPDDARWASVIQVIDAQSIPGEVRVHADIRRQKVICWF